MILIVISSHRLFRHLLPLNCLFPLCCELIVKCLSLFLKISFLLSTLEPIIRHFCFEQKNDLIIPVYSEYSVPQSRMLGMHPVYYRIENETQSNGYLELFYLFLFWNKVNRTHPKFDYDFQLQTASSTTTLLNYTSVL